jgi:hypothetical protein
MRRIAPTMVVALVLTISMTVETADAHSRTAQYCPPQSAHFQVVIADAQAEIYEAPERPQNSEFLGVYGCSFKDKRSYYLGPVPEAVGTPAGNGGVKRETLAGTFAAYEESSSNPLGADWGVTVRNLRNGKVVHRVPTGTPSEATHTVDGVVVQNEGVGPAMAIVVKSDGAVAWIAQAPGGGEGYQYQVHALDKTGSRLLAASTEVDPFSLALAGSTLYWTQDGKPKSASLE